MMKPQALIVFIASAIAVFAAAYTWTAIFYRMTGGYYDR